MPLCDTLIRNVRVLDGSGAEAETADVAIDAGVVCAVGQLSQYVARQVTEGEGRVLSPGFIDVHTHDDTNVIRDPTDDGEAVAGGHDRDRRQLRHQRGAGAVGGRRHPIR